MPAKSAAHASETDTHADATLDELKSLLAEAEKALSSAGDGASEEVTALRGRLRDALAEGRAGARRLYERAKDEAHRADEAIHTHPYVAIGIAAGVGLLAGALISRSCHHAR